MNRRIPLAPVEGWATVGLTLLLCLTFAWSLDDARWVLGRPEYLDFLQWMALGGVIAGLVLEPVPAPAVGFIGMALGAASGNPHSRITA